MHYRPDIDGLRAVAVLAVVVFHAFPAALPGGFIGVDVFFVISGYLITGLLLKDHREHGRIDLVAFYARRARRIFPALTLVLIASLAVGWRWLVPDEYAALGWQTVAGAAFFSNVSLAAQADYFHASASRPLLHLWSLAIEEQFYVLWPAVLLLILRLGRRSIAVAALGASFIAGCVLPADNPTAGYFAASGRWWQLLSGALLAMGESSDKAPWRTAPAAAREAAALGGTALLALGFVIVDAKKLYPETQALIPTAAAALLIASGPSTWVARTALGVKPMVAIGLVSYPLYLWHWPMLVWVRTEGPTSVPATLAVLLAGLVLAAATYLLVERPIRTRARLDRAALAAAAALVAVGLAGWATHATSGVPQRLPPDLRAALAQDTAPASWRIGQCLLERPVESAFSACSGARPEVALLGDSHAAVLYAGLAREAARAGRGIGQYNVAGCAPWHQPGSVKCAQLWQAAIGRVRGARPDTVMLHANWGRYPQREQLSDTITELKAIGVRRVVVLGGVPTWRARMNTLLWAHWRQHHSLPGPRSIEWLAPGGEAVDAELERIATAAGAVFVSARAPLCNASGCLVLMPDGPVAYIDDTHLNEAGANWLATAIWSDVRR
jgi:peptidoglycan/LPS O-acetylase OafA/YrhL